MKKEVIESAYNFNFNESQLKEAEEARLEFIARFPKEKLSSKRIYN